jgi:pimeloyl-ACP methyl ester carboxylesterase
MLELSFSPALDLVTRLGRSETMRPFRMLFRGARHRLLPPRPVVFHPRLRRAQDAVLARGLAKPHQQATILRELRIGNLPTIVLGGFVPDATEQVFLLRSRLLRSGSLYYLNYSRHGFSLDLLCAQLDDLVEELTAAGHQRPVMFSVSFGCGLLLEWLRRTRLDGRTPRLGGIVLVSPVACVDDLLDPCEPRPSTLLGRAIKPYLQTPGPVSEKIVERSRAVFTKMFEAGAQNKDSLRGLMTRRELQRLRAGVLDTIQSIDAVGARERVQALREMPMLSSYFSPDMLPLSTAPAMILYAEKEGSVITENSPTRFALEKAHGAYFSDSSVHLVSNPRGSPVQHASLVFHVSNFKPCIKGFYQGLKRGKHPRVP